MQEPNHGDYQTHPIKPSPVWMRARVHTVLMHLLEPVRVYYAPSLPRISGYVCICLYADYKVVSPRYPQESHIIRHCHRAKKRHPRIGSVLRHPANASPAKPQCWAKAQITHKADLTLIPSESTTGRRNLDSCLTAYPHDVAF